MVSIQGNNRTVPVVGLGTSCCYTQNSYAAATGPTWNLCRYHKQDLDLGHCHKPGEVEHELQTTVG